MLPAYIFINAFWEELPTHPTNTSTRNMQRRAKKYRAGYFSSREIPESRHREAQHEWLPPGRERNLATISEEEEKACKPHPPELTAGWMDGFWRSQG